MQTARVSKVICRIKSRLVCNMCNTRTSICVQPSLQLVVTCRTGICRLRPVHCLLMSHTCDTPKQNMLCEIKLQRRWTGTSSNLIFLLQDVGHVGIHIPSQSAAGCPCTMLLRYLAYCLEVAPLLFDTP